MDAVKAFEMPADMRKFAHDAGGVIRLQTAYAKVPKTLNKQTKESAEAAAKFAKDTVSTKPL
jgi:hypothetical protein